MTAFSKFTVFTFVIGLGFSASFMSLAGQTTYRWVDAKGRSHYSDVKTPNSNKVRPPPGAAAVQAATEQRKASDQAAHVAECERLREQLATYISAEQVSETDALGNTKNYSSVEKDQLVAKTQAKVRETCG